MLPVQLAEIDIGIETRMGRMERMEEAKERLHFGPGGKEEVALASQQVAKQKACATALQQWKEVTLKNGTRVPLLQEVEFCAEGDTYVEAQQSAEAQAKNFLDGIEAEKAAKAVQEMNTRRLQEIRDRCVLCGPKF